MVRIKRRFTPEEKQVIVNCVESNPGNLRCAFEVAGVQLNRSAKSIENHYYSLIKKQQICVAVASGTSVYIGKNAIREQVVPDANNIKDAMIYASLKNMSREHAIEFLMNKISNEEKSKILMNIVNKLVA